MSVAAQPVSPTFVSVTNFSKRVDACPVTVRNWILRGLPACRVDRRWRIELEAGLAWMRGTGRGH
jgi:hypothetical protein